MLSLTNGKPMHKYRNVLVIVAWALLSSCSSSTSYHQALGISAEEMQALQDLERLKESHAALAARLTNVKKEDFPTDFALLDDMGQRIVTLQKNQLEKSLGEKRIRELGDYQDKIPLPELAQLQQQLQDDANLTPALVQQVQEPIIRERSNTVSLIGRLEAEASRQDLTAERRATVYHQLYVVSGEKRWADIRDRQMDIIIKAIHSAAENNNFSAGMEDKIDFVRGIYVSQPENIVEDMQSLYADFFANRYAKLQTKGDREGAFNVLQKLTQKQDYPQIVTKLGERANKIADDYAGYVTESVTRRWGLAESLKNYQREIEVRALLNLKPNVHPETSNLVQQFAEKFRATKDKNAYAALGFLLAQEVVAPQASGRFSSITEQQLAQIRGSTISSLSVEKFRSRYDSLNFGEIVTPLISQYLQQLIGQNIRIVEGSTAGVDALVTGNILEAKVESSQTRNKKQMRVNVGEIQRTNPAYLAWLELSPKERKNAPKPDETISEPKQETVFITATMHRKVGIFAVTYRLVDNKNNRVIFPDSITLQAQYEDESNEGLEVGELVVPYKLAKLPSDTEILQKLSQDVAETIAGNLIGVLENQEIEYLKLADKAAAQNICSEEVENLAKAFSLLAGQKERKEVMDKTQQRLVQRSLTCF
jgi:hypothetical protein